MKLSVANSFCWTETSLIMMEKCQEHSEVTLVGPAALVEREEFELTAIKMNSDEHIHPVTGTLPRCLAGFNW